MRRFGAFAIVWALCTVLPRAAHADWRDVGVGVYGAWVVPDGGRAGAAAELGLNDFTAARLELGYTHAAHKHSAQALVGPTFTWDVLRWVPAITVLGGVDGSTHLSPVLMARLEARRYISQHVWLSAGVGGEFRRDTQRVHVLVSMFWQV